MGDGDRGEGDPEGGGPSGGGGGAGGGPSGGGGGAGGGPSGGGGGAGGWPSGGGGGAGGWPSGGGGGAGGWLSGGGGGTGYITGGSTHIAFKSRSVIPPCGGNMQWPDGYENVFAPVTHSAEAFSWRHSWVKSVCGVDVVVCNISVLESIEATHLVASGDLAGACTFSAESRFVVDTERGWAGLETMVEMLPNLRDFMKAAASEPNSCVAFSSTMDGLTDAYALLMWFLLDVTNNRSIGGFNRLQCRIANEYGALPANRAWALNLVLSPPMPMPPVYVERLVTMKCGDKCWANATGFPATRAAKRDGMRLLLLEPMEGIEMQILRVPYPEYDNHELAEFLYRRGLSLAKRLGVGAICIAGYSPEL